MHMKPRRKLILQMALHHADNLEFLPASFSSVSPCTAKFVTGLSSRHTAFFQVCATSIILCLPWTVCTFWSWGQTQFVLWDSVPGSPSFPPASCLTKQGSYFNLTSAVLRLPQCVFLIISLTCLHILFLHKLMSFLNQDLGVKSTNLSLINVRCHLVVTEKTRSTNKGRLLLPACTHCHLSGRNYILFLEGGSQVCDIFRKISIKMVGILRKYLETFRGYTSIIWRLVGTEHFTAFQRRIKGCSKGIEHVKVPPEPMQDDALRPAIALLMSQGKIRKVADKS